MKTARHFIVMRCSINRQFQPLRIELIEYHFNEFAALVALTAAADRLSDFIIVRTLGRKSNEKGERNKACEKLRVSALGSEADALQEGFKAIGKAREARQKVVHGLATQPAHVQKHLITAEREAFEKRRWHTDGSRDAPYEDVIREQGHLDAKELAEVEARAKLLCDCYVKLVKMGELSFPDRTCLAATPEIVTKCGLSARNPVYLRSCQTSNRNVAMVMAAFTTRRA